VRAVPKRDGNCVCDEWQHSLSFIGRQFDAEPTIENNKNAVLARQVRLQEGHTPAVNYDVVMFERAWKVDAPVDALGLTHAGPFF
jgi:hypothetical protein